MTRAPCRRFSFGYQNYVDTDAINNEQLLPVSGTIRTWMIAIFTSRLYPKPTSWLKGARASDLGGNPSALLSGRELVPERAAWCTLHDRLVARQADFAAARGDDVEIGFADQQGA